MPSFALSAPAEEEADPRDRRGRRHRLAVLIIDGKSVRGSRTRDHQAVHLLAAMTPTAHVAAQIRVADKTSEIPALKDVLDGLDIEGSVISADALHTQTDTAKHLVDERKAHYLLTVKRNQPTLFAQVKALPWAQAPTLFTETSRGHGRAERRTVKVLTAPRIAFPHAAHLQWWGCSEGRLGSPRFAPAVPVRSLRVSLRAAPGSTVPEGVLFPPSCCSLGQGRFI